MYDAGIDPGINYWSNKQNQLFKSQMEALIVAFELVWKIAKVNFVDNNRMQVQRELVELGYSEEINVINSCRYNLHIN